MDRSPNWPAGRRFWITKGPWRGTLEFLYLMSIIRSVTLLKSGFGSDPVASRKTPRTASPLSWDAASEKEENRDVFQCTKCSYSHRALFQIHVNVSSKRMKPERRQTVDRMIKTNETRETLNSRGSGMKGKRMVGEVGNGKEDSSIMLLLTTKKKAKSKETTGSTKRERERVEEGEWKEESREFLWKQKIILLGVKGENEDKPQRHNFSHQPYVLIHRNN